MAKTSRTDTGTKTTFKFDPEIFKGDLDFRFDTLVQRFREMAFVTRGVTIFLLDERTDREMTFYFEGGITSFVRYLNRNRQVLHPVVHVEKEVDGITIDAAIQYTDAYAEVGLCLCQHDQHHRWRYASDRSARRGDPHDQ